MAAVVNRQTLLNRHLPGNMAVLVQAPVAGPRSFKDAVEARRPD